MSKFWEKVKNHRIFGIAVQAVGVTLLAYLLSELMLQPFAFSANSVFSPEDRSDFMITDFFHIVADNRPISELDTSIVIISSDGMTRDSIAYLLDELSLHKPKAVGIDIIFEQPRDNDTLLANAIKKLHKPIMAVEVEMIDPDDEIFGVAYESAFDSLLIEAEHGSVNLPIKHQRGTVRKYRKTFPTLGGDIRSFSAELARIAYPAQYRRLMQEPGEEFNINFPSREFVIISKEDFYDHPDTVNSRIVMIGDIYGKDDQHLVPTGKTISGIEIHSHALATILGEHRISPLSKWQNRYIALVLCYLMSFLSLLFDPGYKGIVLRLVQIILLYILIYFGYIWFIDRGVMLDLALPILMVAFALFASDIWIGCRTFLRWRRKKRTEKIMAQLNIENKNENS